MSNPKADPAILAIFGASASGIFEPVWNRRYLDHVQMTVAEEDGIGSRGAHCDKPDALRDLVRNQDGRTWRS